MTMQWGTATAGGQTATMCGCIGPQNGEPLCPCRMRGVRQIDGRWVETIDHGPVRAHVPMRRAPRYPNPEDDGA